jgi:hypothetical protein
MKTELLLFVLMVSVQSLLAQGGIPLWTNRLQGPVADRANAITVDHNGNIIVAGSSYPPFGGGGDPFHSEYLTVAYSNEGQLLWSNRYHGPVYGDNVPTAVAVDKNSRVFVTGNAGTLAYSNSGMPLWTNRSAPADAMVLDDDGNVFTTGSSYWGSYSDWITVALSPDGALLWTNRTGLFAADFATSVAVDREGNILVAGSWSWPTGSYDLSVVKYSHVGVPLWTNHFDAGWYDIAAGMAVANDGTVFVTGRSANSGVLNVDSVYDFVTVAFSGNGTMLWTNRYDGPANAADLPAAIELDDQGNVIITGESVGDATGSDYTTIKYSSTGVPVWTNRFHRFGSIGDSPMALAVDGSGNVVVTGSSFLDGYDYATIAYSSVGLPLWTNVYSGPVANGDDVARALALDAVGNVFVTGYSWGGTTGPDFVTIKYSSSLQPYLRIQTIENQAVLTWDNPVFSLQSAPSATGTFTNIWGARSPYTNVVIFPQQFFRLIAN